MARPVDVQPVTAAPIPVKGTPAWAAAHGHGDGCPFDGCDQANPSWSCALLRECSDDQCNCHYGAFL